ncbi:erythromycin esterase family protein [Bacillus toyonensis]|uniref:erythromycin esterase family protein n=1 Tax=Bacillus toyonensis TaxID=155322 RepID=UPI000BFB92B0|nr:erythromycin esterase family protein [Bacillus toyonensis]PHA82274.1 erythromycin esterase [Bacillus toyonensis]
MFTKWKIGMITSLLAFTTFTSVISAEEKPKDQPKWEVWIKENVQKLNEPNAQTNEDLSFLKEKVKDKRIVLLGESTHGAKEINQSKVRMIKYLHEEMGYDVIAFETGFAEANAVNQNLDQFTALQAMKKSLYGVWHTEEILELFQYIKDQKEKGTPLILTGFDAQFRWYSYFPEFAKEWLEKINPEIANDIDKAHTELLNIDEKIESKDNQYSYEQYKAEVQQVIAKYEKIKTFVQQHKAELNKIAPSNTYDVNLLEKTISIRIDTIKTLQDATVKEKNFIYPTNFKPTDLSFYIRDQKMGQALAWLSDIQYKNKKIIVWGHNYHIRKQNSKMILDWTKSQQYNFKAPNMIDYLPQRIKDQMYTIGVYAYSGNSWDSTELDKIVPIDTDHAEQSIENILRTSQNSNVFVNLKGERNRPETSWMFTPTTVRHWGDKDFEEILKPIEQYDGILWLDRISPSQYK